MSSHAHRAPRPLADSLALVLWWGWAWQSSGATAHGVSLAEQLSDRTPWWWWMVLVGLMYGPALVGRVPGSFQRLARLTTGGEAGAVAAAGLTLAALAGPALLFGVAGGFVVSELPLAHRWAGFLDVMLSPVAFGVYAAGVVAVLLARRTRRGRDVTA
ncbi:hypothetical protein [Streptomyces thermolilacinus]|uniref:hypothetical protein n=1 Tax=Streptomyces thermolilacinus TaxID=285540 RepID=UPI0033DA7B14